MATDRPTPVEALRLADAVRQNIIAAVRLQSGRITDDEFDATTREVHAALQAFDAALAAPAVDGLDAPNRVTVVMPEGSTFTPGPGLTPLDEPSREPGEER